VNQRNFFSELRRRNVYKVAVAYAVVGWLLVQVTTQVFPIFEIPNWSARLIVLAIVIGFPIALVIAWAFELTPEGLKRTEDVDLTAGHSCHTHGEGDRDGSGQSFRNRAHGQRNGGHEHFHNSFATPHSDCEGERSES
jgi:hypothetical protein